VGCFAQVRGEVERFEFRHAAACPSALVDPDVELAAGIRYKRTSAIVSVA
jgi:hypothetical protein